MKSRLLDLYQAHFGRRPEAIVDLRADGSNRSLYRLIGPDGASVIGVWGPDADENRAFVSFSRSLRGINLPVPEIHAVDEHAGIYIEEDLGDTTLFAALTAIRADENFPERITTIYRDVVRLLPRVQVEGGRVIDYSLAYPCTEFDRQSMMWDLNYFKYHFMKLARIPFNEARLERDFNHLCDVLLQADRSNFLYRDFQSRNIMLREGVPWLIDYQGGRRGALHYDIASLLYDAKADIPDELRDQLLGEYLDALGQYVQVDHEQFTELYRCFVLIRIMQAMGAYGYRGFFEGKPHFLASVPYAIANIEKLLKRGLPLEMPELRIVLERIAHSNLREQVGENGTGEIGLARHDHDNVKQSAAASATSLMNGHVGPPSSSQAIPAKSDEPKKDAEGAGVLAVTITSFSYRRGYPAETSAHGGGFVFDCRALHNPGRYEPYKALCGRDTDVVEFLEREEKVGEFWNNVRGLVNNAVDNYLERGFSNLSIAFGCTGGQHRSVYFAERLARYLRERYPQVDVTLAHREESRWAESH